MFSYHGTHPFSEPETANERDLLTTLADDVLLLISFHTFGQKWMVPWAGYEEKPEDYDELVGTPHTHYMYTHIMVMNWGARLTVPITCIHI